jgi:NADPH-dependent 2,4-dienoyl-CoA reductase/sulfur reductase-like enzyme
MASESRLRGRYSEMKATNHVVIVGGGPAGLAAAETLARSGVLVTIIDENPDLGGQYYRRRTKGTTDQLGDYRIDGTHLINSVKKLGCTVLTDSYVWGISNDKHSLLVENLLVGKSSRVSFDYLIVASGGHEIHYPFSNWQSTKVMTPGMLSRLVTIDAIEPIGRRAILVGSGPFLLAVASHLIDSGVAVDGVFEVTRPYRVTKFSIFALFFPGKCLLFLHYRFKLLKNGVKLAQGSRLRSVQDSGDGIIATFDNKSGGESVFVESQLLGVGYGFRPNSELLEALNVTREEPTIFGHFYPKVDRFGRTSQANVFAVGEVSGIEGFKSAIFGGVLSGERILREIKGLQGFKSALITWVHQLRSIYEEAFAKFLKKLYQFDLEDFPNLDSGVLLCRCEGIYASELDGVLSQSESDMAYVKSETRIGMGLCQGRMCGTALNILVKKKCPKFVSSGFSVRMPFRPVTIGSVIELESVGTRDDIDV